MESKFKSEASPCERGIGCHNAKSCAGSGRACTQFNYWNVTGFIDVNKSREPKAPGVRRTKSVVSATANLDRNRFDPKDPKVLARQASARKILCELPLDKLKILAELMGYTFKSLRQYRSSGLSIPFISCMESPEIKEWLHENYWDAAA